MATRTRATRSPRRPGWRRSTCIETEGLFERAASLAPYWEQALHSLRGLPHVIDIRNLGLVGGIELEPRAGAPGARGFDVFVDCFNRGAARFA